MDAIPSDLSSSALAARERLSADARASAQAGAAGRSASQAAMATVAREAVFADALLSAMHARLEEMKAIAK